MSAIYQVKLNNGVKKGLKQRDLVNEVVLDYFNSHPSSTLSDLQQAFPAKVQKKLAIVLDEFQAHQLNVDKSGKPRKQYNIFDKIKLPNGMALAICNQWGVANIGNFLDHAMRMGYQIGLDEEEITVGVDESPIKASVKSHLSFDCYNGQNGKMAIIGDAIYFLYAKDGCHNEIYRIPLKGNGSAEKCLDKQGVLSEPSDLPHIYTWNEKLYFSCGSQAVGTPFGDYPNGFFSFDPFTRNIALLMSAVTEAGRFEFSGIYEGKAYGLIVKNGNSITKQFLSLDLLTNKITILPMPAVKRENWNRNNDYAYTSYTCDAFADWVVPTIRSGYAYTSCYGFQTLTLRFPLDHPECFETLPCGVFYHIEPEGCTLLAVSENVLMMPLYINNSFFLCALEHDTLNMVEEFDWQNNPISHFDVKWIQYNDMIAINSNRLDDIRIFSISGHKFMGKAGSAFYADMLDRIMIGDKVYALSDSGKDDVGNTGLCLFSMPKSKLFLKDANPNDYALPLF